MRRQRELPQPQRVPAVDMIGSLEPDEPKRYGELRPEAVDMMAEIYKTTPKDTASFLAQLHLIDPKLAERYPATPEIKHYLERVYKRRLEWASPEDKTATVSCEPMVYIKLLFPDYKIDPEHQQKAWDMLVNEILEATTRHGSTFDSTSQATRALDLLLIDPSRRQDIPLDPTHIESIKQSTHRTSANGVVPCAT
ncbi:MAG: hypothetical protein COW24_04380 [Candidatus Kerfeldbacteria bacterium CG15_BIG_FIL_POST_REV_8_21_14_020_45_12]|uniref:Uncharacterized protein n=1 Tax=Candidatus Kerfeldbacteria bacterium CG15_BIG_FIL_POST_REV_8_21_14_020_45_12 TaxID=2014247 RepID=A0A2M7H301_9BACT|nr:MAG: hypothetical protein COW24_04380 [Candidatus Kerfeldbacteria bacterium CG15_BIG_FIL_POST_REV_8_21_14_020_45_12]PJA93388.1 MAG: hypothetical protein CO132_03465 [Candidatus Kerfeldbacteria bacterium CG_4_9_14_3_um_filter_45_8]